MPDASRNDVPLKNPRYPQGAEREGSTLEQKGFPTPATETSLPPGDIYGQLPASRAENLGRTVGSAVGGILRFPQRIGQATERMRRTGSMRRARASAAVLEIMDTAALRAEHLGRTTGTTMSDWARSARRRTARLEDQAADRWHEVRSAARERLDVAGRRAAAQWNHTQRTVTRLQEEDPGRFLLVVAGAAFVIGAGLRIWRSNSNG